MAIDKKLQRKAQRDLGLTFKALRDAKDIKSAEALAHASNFSASYMAGIESGKRNPSFAMLVQLAQSLEMPLAELATIYDQIAAGGGA
jgi:transcriptional regulator with XRE-family HTH domain